MTRRFWMHAAAIVSLGLTGLSGVQALALTVTPSPAVLTFPAAPVGVTGNGVQKQTITFQITNGTTFIPATAALHYGTSFSAAPISCTGTGNPNETCTVQISFVPSLPGGRRDALFLMNGATRLATVLIYGVGQSPLALMQPGVLTQPITGSGPYLFTSTIDENGTAYVLETGNNAVISVTKAGVVAPLPIAGLNSPRTIGIDGAGVLYIGGETNGGPLITYDTVQNVQGTFPVPPTSHIFADIAVGNTGNIYEVDGNAGVLYTMSSSGISTHQVTLSPVVAGAAGMAIDSSEDIFVGGATMNEITAGGVQTQINANNGQNGLSVDAAGTLYATPYAGFLAVAELPAPYTTPLTAFDPTANAIGASEGPDGTIFVGAYSNLDKIDRTQGVIAFGNIGAVATQNVSIYNGGNQSLTISNIGVAGTGFSLGTASTNNCTGGTTILPGAFCQVAVTLTSPHAGSYTGTLTFTDNSLNNASSAQNVALSGDGQGIYVVVAPPSLNFGNQVVGATSAPQPVTFTNTGFGYSAGIQLPTGTGPFNVSLGTCVSPLVPLAVGASCTMNVAFAPTSVGQTFTNTSIGFVSGWQFGSQPVTWTVSGTGTAYVPYAPPSSGSTAAIVFTPATVNLVAGLNGAGSTGNGGLATAAKLNYPVGLAYDSSGNLFFADESNFVVRRIDHATGNISVFAGTNGVNGFSTGGGVATSAQLASVSGLVIDTGNNVYVADRSNNVVWKIASGGAISVYAGGGSGGLGDGGVATAGKLNNPWALGIDASNNIYIADTGNNVIRVVNNSTNIITTFAGVVADAGSLSCASSLYSTSTPPYTALQAHLCFPQGIAFDSSGNAYIVDTKNNIVRVVSKATGFITTFAGGGASLANGVPATTALFDLPAGVYVDPANRVYIGDFFHNVIRVVDALGNINTVFGTGSGSMIGSIGLPDTESTSPSIGPADGIYDFTMDPFGNLVATDSSGSAITSAGSTGQYIFPQQQVYVTSAAAFVTISNPSGVNLIFTGTPTVTGPFAISGGTCSLPGSLAPGASCTLGITFTPIADQLYTGSIVLGSNANSSPSTINLSGTGIGTATIIGTLTSSLPNFTGTVGVTSASQTATLTNTGQAPLAINTAATSFTGANPTDFALASTDCPAMMSAGNSCHFNVTFTPAAATTYSAQLQVVVTNYGNLHTTLTGTGTAASAPAVTITPNPDAFLPSPVGQPENAPTPMTLTNSGTGPLTISGITITGINAGSFSQTNLCPATLAAGAACGITVLFTPAASGPLTANVSVASNASGSPALAVLTGTGTVPLVTLNPNPLGFGSQQVNTASSPQSVTVSNTGGAPLLITSAVVGGTNASDFAESASCPNNVAAGANCVFTFIFTPGGTGARSATLTITDNASGSPQVLNLTGTGTAAAVPQAVLTPNPLAFPSATVGTPTTLPLVLSNPGNGVLNVNTYTVTGTNASNFTFTNGCSASLAAGASCTLMVTFTPTAAGSFTATMNIADNASGSPHTATLTGTGTAPLVATVAPLSPNPLSFSNTIVGSTATAVPVTVSNTGAATLTGIAFSLLGTNPGDFATTSATTCGTTLAAGANCLIYVSFTPASAATFTATLSVSDSASGSPQTATVTGTGVTAATAFTVASSTPLASVQPGGLAQYNLTIAPAGGTYTNLVTLSATGLPAGAVATFLPAAVTPGSAGAPSVLSIQTPSLLARERGPDPQHPGPAPLLALLSGVSLLGLAAPRRLRKASRRWMLLAITALAILPALAMSGCSGGYFGPVPKTFTVTVTGTSGTLTQTTTVSLTVQ